MAVRLSVEREQLLAKVGFPKSPKNGDTVLPNPVGKVSSFNALGAWKRRDDLPKEKRITGQRVWRWTEWHGRDRVERERIVDIEQWCYPKEFKHPIGIELTFVDTSHGKLVVSPILTKSNDKSAINLHAINLFLELFGECLVVGKDYQDVSSLKIKRLAWELLPSGEQPFPKLKEFLERKWRNTDGDRAKVILDRQQTILGFAPDEIYEGIGGFSNYLAFVFASKDLVILESVAIDNAIYVFGDDWRELSKLSKAQILTNNLQVERIVHQTGWKAALARLLSDPNEALAIAS